ncbi:hypothetical protein [Jiulongibacter sp. NS-SX5]|uniref:hypothetical protein n=1 Tax=Jiulongibacter sp. NS-SX5 TaxID=3463854 RepID=UPI004058B569
MKKLAILLLFAPLVGLSQRSDTLQVKVKDSAELIIVVKDPEAYEELRNMDINKMVDQMLSNLEKSETRVAVMRDRQGDQFQKEKKKLFSKAYLNYQFGWADVGNSYNSPELSLIQAANSYLSQYSNSGDQLMVNFNSILKNSVLKSPYISLSVNTDMILVERQKMDMAFKLSAEPFFSYESLKFDPGSRTGLLGIGGIFRTEDAADVSMVSPGFVESRIIDTLAIANYNEINNTYTYKLYSGESEPQSFSSIPYDVLKAGLNLRVMPKFSFYNKEGKRSFSWAFGPTAGLNLIRKSITKVNNSEFISDPILISGSKPALTRYGLVTELGVGGVSFFGQYVISQTRYEGNGLQVLKDYQGPALLSSTNTKSFFEPTATKIVNFGLKFGI